MINSAKTDTPVLLLVYRSGTTLFLAV
jgi:hypothetical protein